MTRLLALLAVLVGLAAPAHAEEVPPTAAPAVVYPLTDATGAPAHRIRLEAGPRTWRAKQVARWWDAAIPGLSIEVAPCIPELPCVRVSVGSWDEEEMLAISHGYYPEWAGIMTYTSITDRHILLNRSVTTEGSGLRRRVASHEIGHALGLGHHSQPRGLLCASTTPCKFSSWVWQPTANELAPLVVYFGGP